MASIEPTPPPEAQTEAEKTAYCAGWWAALEAVRTNAAEPQHKPGCALLQIPARECDCAVKTVQEPETFDQRVVPLVESALQAVAENIGDQCAVWYGIGARDVEEVLREAARHGLVRGALAEPVQEPAFHGFMSADGTRVDLCFTPGAPRADGVYATAYYTAPPQPPAQPAQPAEDPDPWGSGYEAGYQAGVAEYDPQQAQQALSEADRIMGHEDEATEWRQRWVHLFTAPPKRPAEPVQEPFGYFRAEPFGWTDCAATDEGAIPLYTRPSAHQPLTVERLRDALVSARIVPPAAVEDPDGYDDGVTLLRIEALHRRLA